jgi:hypothetical protein
MGDWLPLANYCRVLELASDECGCPAFGLSLGLGRPTDVLGDAARALPPA